MAENEGKTAAALSSPTDSDEGQAKSDAGAATPRAGGAVPTRDVPLSTFVHLLGLSTATQMSLVETKVDAMSSKLATALIKLERLASDVSEIKGDAAVDRIDFQLNDIRNLLKRLAPGMSGGAAAPDGDAGKSPASRAKVLKSEPGKPETKIVENDNLQDLSQAADNEAFQAAEAQRMRDRTKEGA